MSGRDSIGVALALVLAFAIAWVIATRSAPLTYPTAGTNIVAFGDSLVFGVGTTKGNDFVSLLSARIGKPIINLGVSGNTVADGLARIDDVLAEDPHVVIVLLGGNDTLRRVPVEQTFADLAQIIERLQSAGAGVVLVGAPGGLYGARYDKEYAALAKTYGVAYVPNILRGLLGKQEYMADAIHPNNDGHRIMADRIEPALRDMLAGGR